MTKAFLRMTKPNRPGAQITMTVFLSSRFFSAVFEDGYGLLDDAFSTVKPK
jgi:hypothetical protein